MKKYIKYLAIAAIALPLLNSCKKFVEGTPRGQFTEDGYYRDANEAFTGLVACYDVLGYQGNNFVTKVDAAISASDEAYAGGGGSNDVPPLQVFSNYTLDPATGPQDELWTAGFAGVSRVNTLLSKLPNVPMDENLKKRFAAEAKVIRAYSYFDLVRWFKNVPLILAPVPKEQAFNIPQVTPAEIYAQIEKDLTEAAAETNLPDKVNVATDGGRITQGIVHALLGKVYLYQKKYAAAVTELAKVNGTPGQPNAVYGYNLVSDFASLWKVSNKFNSESILEISHTSSSNGTWGCLNCTEGNILNIIAGPRNYNALKPTAPDYNAGYGFLPVTKVFYDAMHYDPRNKASIANLDSLVTAGQATYEQSYMNTGFFIEKYAGRVADLSKGGGDSPLNFPQNMYEIRLADTYLMEAEALILGGGDISRATALITAIRNRAYNDGQQHAVAPTLDNVINERKMELAFEGHRWFDLVRWGKAPAVLGSRGFVAGKNEILPIPLKELENTKILQSKEWGGTK